MRKLDDILSEVPQSKKKQIESMYNGGRILGEVLFEVTRSIAPGMSEIEIDKLTEKLIIEKGGEPGFKKVYGYKYATCLSTNNVVVHGLPTKRTLFNGDIIGVDCGVFYNGYHTDMSETVKVTSEKSRVKGIDQTDEFLEVGKKALYRAIEQAKPGNRVGHISKAIQETVETAGYSVVRNLVGHGIGQNLHEDPAIPGYLAGNLSTTPLLTVGKTLAIEVIYNMGKKEVMYEGSDDWTIVTKDRSLSGVFERTIVITGKGCMVLTELKKAPLRYVHLNIRH